MFHSDGESASNKVADRIFKPCQCSKAVLSQDPLEESVASSEQLLGWEAHLTTLSYSEAI